MSIANRWLLIILVVALAGRFAFAWLVIGLDKAPIGDEIDYHTIASNVAAGGGYMSVAQHPTARRPPLYPLLLATIYKLTGPGVAAARIAQVLLGTLLVCLVFAVCKRLLEIRAAFVAAALVALNPFLIFASGYLLTENLYIGLLLAGLLAVGIEPSAPLSWRRALGAGVVFGLAALTRSTAILFEGLVLLWFLFSAGRMRAAHARRIGLIIVTTFVVLTPWALRNQSAMGKWMFSTSHGGITFYQGNNAKVLEVPQYKGGVAPLYALPGHAELDAMSELDSDRAAWAMGVGFIRENPAQIPRLVWNKFLRCWRFRTDQGMSGIRSGWWFGKDSALGKIAASLDVGFVYSALVIPLFLIGVVLSRRRAVAMVPLYGIVVLHTLIALVFYGSLRMRLPIEPVTAMFAGYALNELFARFRRYRQR